MKAKYYIILIILLTFFLFSMQLCSLIFGSKPKVTITNPKNGATISGDTLTVEGTIEDLDGDQTKVKVWIEDKNISGWDYNFSSGYFKVTLTLVELTVGQTYRIIAEGYDANGNRSDFAIVSITYSSNNPNLIPNGKFDNPNYADYDITYTNESTINNYLNKTNGDYLPSWTFEIWNPVETEPKIDIDIGSVRMYTTKENYYGAQINMQSSTINNFKTGSGKTIKIIFKITSYTGGTLTVPYYEGPVKIDIVINGSRCTIAAFTSSSGSAPGGYFKTNLPTNQTITETFTLPTTRLDGTSLDPDLTIEKIVIWCHGWNWDVTIYSIEVY